MNIYKRFSTRAVEYGHITIEAIKTFSAKSGVNSEEVYKRFSTRIEEVNKLHITTKEG